jgi:rod shape-determining protein MreC
MTRPTRPSRRRLALALVAATAVLLVLDLAGAPGASQVRAAGAAVFGPLETLARGGLGAQVDPGGPADDRVRTSVESAARDQHVGDARRLADLLESSQTRGAPLVPARVVAVRAEGASGPSRVTVDAGSRDGVSEGLTVVSAEGLVGRVVSVAPWTADVLLLGAADATVGVRVGQGGTLGAVTGAAGPRPRRAGLLGLTLVQRGSVAVGDQVTTLGSPGGRPFRPGITVGRVTAVDPGRGELAPTAAVAPAVDVTTLDVVGVLLGAPRSTPRPTLTGGRR